MKASESGLFFSFLRWAYPFDVVWLLAPSACTAPNFF